MNRKRIIAIIAVIALACLCSFTLAGCGAPKEEEETTIPASANDPAVVGTWSEPDFDSGYVFNEDLTGRDTYWDGLTFTYTAYDGVITITYDDETYAVDRYSYTVDGDTLSMARLSDGGAGKSFTYTRG